LLKRVSQFATRRASFGLSGPVRSGSVAGSAAESASASKSGSGHLKVGAFEGFKGRFLLRIQNGEDSLVAFLAKRIHFFPHFSEVSAAEAATLSRKGLAELRLIFLQRGCDLCLLLVAKLEL